MQHAFKMLRVMPVVLVLLAAASGVPQPGIAQTPISNLKNPEEIRRIAEAIPQKARVTPQKPRKLLLFCLNVNYGGHPSAEYANHAFTLIGEKTGAFQAVVSRDPEVFRKESLKQFDAVFFNNNVGNLFTNAELRQNLVEFVLGGGGMLGVHGTSVAFTQWPGAAEDWREFGVMIGARGANHRESTEHVWIRLDDPEHPVVQTFGGQSFDYRDEFFRVHDPYSRNRVRVLLSMDTQRTQADQGRGFGNLTRPDNDYALAWIRSYGQGRVFYCTIAHNPYVFWDPKMLQFYLDAIQFALGDLPAPTLPSTRLTPATRAQEKLGWRLGIEAYTFHKFTFFETIDKTAQLGLPYVGGLSFQKVGGGIDKNFEPQLSDAELQTIRLKLDAAGLRLLTYYIHDLPKDPVACRKIFEFGRKMGIETFMSEPAPEALDTVEKLCEEFRINVALHNHDAKASPVYWNPENIAKLCQGRSKRIGACGDLGYWQRAGIDPLRAIQVLRDRLITVQVHDLDTVTPEGHDLPWGTGVSKLALFLNEMHRLGIKPTMFGLEYSYDWHDNLPEITQSIEFFNQTSLKLAK